MHRPYCDHQFRETASERAARWREIKQARIDAGLCPICAKAQCKCAASPSVTEQEKE
jgi:hypothetical protein